MSVATRIGCVLLGLVLAGAVGGEAPGDGPRPLPGGGRKAWGKGGGAAGGGGAGGGGREECRGGAGPGKAGEVPAFRLPRWQTGLTAKLPAPERGFGLDLSYARVTVVGLKELAGLQHLQMLNLGYTQLTDAGLKELAELRQLHTL